MRIGSSVAGLTLAAASALPAAGQYPGQIKTQDAGGPVLRSVVVVEWTGGELSKAKASRVIPVCVWDGQQLQDGGIYLARPQPLALDSEVEYELEQNGTRVGYFDIRGAAEQQGSWIGVGKWKPLPPKPSPAELARMRAKIRIDMDDEDSDQPILHRKYHPDEKGGGTDAARPTLHKGGDASGSDSASSAPPPDPDRPRLHADTNSASGTDADRPKLGRKTTDNDEAYVSSVANVDESGRPVLKRGAPAEYGPEVKPNLMGLPPDMKQEVGVSYAGEIKDHPWDYSWANPETPRQMKAALEAEARKALGIEEPAPAAAAPATAKKTATGKKPTATPPPAPPMKLVDEQFRVFELSYGGGATMVFSAHTDGAGAQQKFVTLIARPDLYGGVAVLLKNVTDAAHLDQTPRMRLVDAVDALGDNRGELLFELRGRSQRQFALYRVLRGQATQIFTTGMTYFGGGAE